MNIHARGIGRIQPWLDENDDSRLLQDLRSVRNCERSTRSTGRSSEDFICGTRTGRSKLGLSSVAFWVPSGSWSATGTTGSKTTRWTTSDTRKPGRTRRTEPGDVLLGMLDWSHDPSASHGRALASGMPEQSVQHEGLHDRPAHLAVPRDPTRMGAVHGSGVAISTQDW